MSRLVKAWPVAASIAMLVLAFPPFNFSLLAFVALVPWLKSLKDTDPKGAFRSGVLFGVLFWLHQLFFLVPFVGRWTESWVLGSIPWLLGPVIGCWYFAGLAWLIQRAFVTGRPWLVPFAWVAVEAGRSYFPMLAFPWGLISTPLWIAPQLIQSAALGTQFLTSGWVAFVNVFVMLLFDGIGRQRLLRYGLWAFAPILLSTWRYTQVQEGQPMTIMVGQPGLDFAFGSPEKIERDLPNTLEALAATAEAKGVKLLILPEGLARTPTVIPPEHPFIRLPRVPTLFGMSRIDGGDAVFQSAYGYENGRWQIADKTRLVVFGEYVPFREYIPFLDAMRLPSGDILVGDKTTAMDLGGIRVGPIICFEALFPNIADAQVRNGAQLLAVISIDDWYMGTNAPEQLTANAIFRAVESGLPLVRSATLGTTLSVTARGQIVDLAEMRKPFGLETTLLIPSRSDSFPFRRLVPWLSLPAVLWILAEPIIRKRRRQRDADPSTK